MSNYHNNIVKSNDKIIDTLSDLCQHYSYTGMLRIQCSWSDSIRFIFDNLGKHAFVISSFQGNPVHNYNTQIYFPIDRSNFQVAVSKIIIYLGTSTIAGYNPAGGFVFNVEGKLKNDKDELLITLHIDNGVQWNSIQISYFATSRTDLTVGTVIVGIK